MLRKIIITAVILLCSCYTSRAMNKIEYPILLLLNIREGTLKTIIAATNKCISIYNLDDLAYSIEELKKLPYTIIEDELPSSNNSE
jgi:hypothetical protein